MLGFYYSRDRYFVIIQQLRSAVVKSSFFTIREISFNQLMLRDNEKDLERE